MKSRKKLDKKQICDIFMGVIIQIYCFFPWIPFENGNMNIWMYLIRDRKAEDSGEWYRYVFLRNVQSLPSDAAAIPAFIRFLLIMIIVIQIISLLYCIVSVRKSLIVDFLGRIRTVLFTAGILMGGLVANLGFSSAVATPEGKLVTTVSLSVTLYLFIFLALVGVWMIAGRMLESWDEDARRVKMEREQKRLYKKEKKKRLYFPGRYSRIYYELLLKDFKCRGKSYLFLVFSVFLSAFFLFAGIGMRSIFGAGYEESGSGVLGLGLVEIMQDFLLVITVVGVFLITIVLYAYRKKRLESMGVFHILGIRSDALFKEWIGEMTICFLGAVSAGELMGSVFLHFLKKFLGSVLPAIGELGNAGWGTY